jgi:DNA-directed RNA polymerase subunit RPC12/RpoP
MAEETTDKTKPRRTFDSAYGFSFAIAVGLILFIGGLIISLTVGQGRSIGLIFGLPLLAAGLMIPMVMLRDLFKSNEVSEPCPNCGATIRTSDATLQLRCPSCHKVINVRESRFYLGE